MSNSKLCLILKALLRQDDANYADVVSHVHGFEEKIIEC